jgi:hypothetical protein
MQLFVQTVELCGGIQNEKKIQRHLAFVVVIQKAKCI